MTSQRATAPCMGKWCVVSLTMATLVHIILVWNGASTLGPTVDEPGHLAAGVHYWRTGDFSLYCVNPPLHKMIGSAPAFLLATHAPRVETSGAYRPEWLIGHAFFRDNPDSRALLTYARRTTLCFSLLAAFIIAHWAYQAAGSAACCAAHALWCLSPTVIAHSSLFTMDIAGAAVGCIALRSVSRWNHDFTAQRAAYAGTIAGIAVLTKSTWIVLYPVIFALAALRLANGLPIRCVARQTAVLLFVSWVVVNSGYLWTGLFEPLATDSRQAGGWLSGTLTHQLPVPLPRSLVQGILFQRHDLLSAPTTGGVGYLHLISLKTPLGTIILAACAVLAIASTDGRIAFLKLIRETPAFAFSTVLILLTVSQVRICEIRYLLPVFPAIGVTLVVMIVRAVPRVSTVLLALVIGINCAELSLSYPYYVGYVSYLAGGTMSTAHKLSGGNGDWGQDIPLLEKWVAEHDVESIAVACISGLPWESDRYIDVFESAPDQWRHASVLVLSSTVLDSDGWGLAGRNRGHPIGRIGSSLFVFSIDGEIP